MKRLKYIGTGPKSFLGIPHVKPGEVIMPPDELVEGLMASGEFELLMEPNDEPKVKRPAVKEEG